MFYVLVTGDRRDCRTHDETGMFPHTSREQGVGINSGTDVTHMPTHTHTLNLLVCWFLSRNWGVFARPICAHVGWLQCDTRSWLRCLCVGVSVR